MLLTSIHREIGMRDGRMFFRPVLENLLGHPAPDERFVQHAFQGGKLRELLIVEVDRMAGDENERHAGQQGASLGDKFKAVKLGHVEVGDDGADINLRERGERFERPGKSEDRTVQVITKKLRQQVDVGRFIIDDDNGFFSRRSGHSVKLNIIIIKCILDFVDRS
jgi:hypothetical protein